MKERFLPAALLALVAAVFVLSLTSTYSSWVASKNHRNSCNSRDRVLDTLHDVVTEAFTPFPGQTFSAAQARLIADREASLFNRINQARC